MRPNIDVKQHQSELNDGGEWPIRAKNIMKVYPSGLMAVVGNSFGVAKGSILGLLGPNGAGKSSTFSMLAMEQPITKGEACILGNDTRKINLTDKGKGIGMCPQYNPIWHQLTVKENLQFLARVKGLSSEEFENNHQLIVETLDLTEFLNVRAGNLSGGNKRKLSCALTLLVSPKIEFLDEPTTGVDPVSRRSLFRMIKQLKDSSIVLTTHRMDEAEMLCDQIAIMINGRIVCYGTPNYLLATYGGGYEFTIEVDKTKHDYEAVPGLIEQRLPNTFEIQHQGQSNISTTMWEIHLQLIDPTMPLSRLFSALSDLKDNDNLFENFYATRSTLEQVFV